MEKHRVFCVGCNKVGEIEKEERKTIRCMTCGEKAYVEVPKLNEQLRGEVIKEIFEDDYIQIILTESGKKIEVVPQSYDAVGLEVMKEK